MTLRSSDLHSDSDLDSIRNSCDVFFDKTQTLNRTMISPPLVLTVIMWPFFKTFFTKQFKKSERPVDALAENGKSLNHPLTAWNQEMLVHLKIKPCGRN